MDSVTIDGVEYVRASVLAKQYRYTTDYIGQLCRARKVDSHLVGRTWYVYPPSLASHKDTRYAELRSNEKTSVISTKIENSRRDVNSPISKKTVKAQNMHFQNRVLWKPGAYEDDSSDLLPKIEKDLVHEPQKMNITMAESERVRVAGVSKNVTMISQPLPAVALSGTLKVLDFSPDFDEEDEVNAVEKHSYDDNRVNRVASDATVSTELLEGARKLSVGASGMRPPATLAAVKRLAPEVHTKAAHTPAKGVSDTFAVNVPTQHLHIPKSVPKIEPKETSLFFRLVIAPAVLLLTLAVASALLTLESVTLVEGTGKQAASLRLNPSLLSSFFDFK